MVAYYVVLMRNTWISPMAEVFEVIVPGTHFRIAETICKNKGVVSFCPNLK
jgi:hypothetical protein